MKQKNWRKILINSKPVKKKKDAILRQFGNPKTNSTLSQKFDTIKFGAIASLNAGNEKLASKYLKYELDTNRQFKSSQGFPLRHLYTQNNFKRIYVNRFPWSQEEANKIFNEEKEKAHNPNLQITISERPKIFKFRHYKAKNLRTKMLINKVTREERMKMDLF